MGHAHRANQRGGRSLCRPLPRLSKETLLQVRDGRQVKRELGDAGGTAPVGAETAGVDRREAAAEPSGVVAGEGVAITLREIGVVVAQIKREHLVGEAKTYVPSVVARLRNTKRKRSATKRACNRGAVKGVRGAEPLATEFTGDIHADAA